MEGERVSGRGEEEQRGCESQGWLGKGMWMTEGRCECLVEVLGVCVCVCVWEAAERL